MKFILHHIKPGAKKIKCKFAILPIRIANEIRWFENVSYEIECQENKDGKKQWVKTRFL